MQKLSAFIVQYRKWIALLFLALVIFSAFSFSWVNVEEDITTYLPDSAAAKQGLNVMNEEFTTYASATVFVRDIDAEDAEALNDKIANLDGVLQVTFDANSESSYKDRYAKYAVIFSGPAEKQEAIDGMANLQAAVTDYNAQVISSSFSSYSDELTEQMGGVLIFVAILVVIVLLLTSTTFAEVPVFLITFLVAAIINMGTNFLMGTISFVSNSVAIVLQLALSVDYAIILCNRYKEEHQTHDIKESVRLALAYSIPAISSSSLTTIAGLAAMAFMQFQLGLDMGIALIKAIVISLLTVFLLMPFMLCVFGKWMDKTKHRSFIPKVDFLGKFAHKTRFIIPPLLVGLIVLGYFGYNQVKYDYDGSLVSIANETEDRAATREMAEIFGYDYTIALMVPSGDYETESKLVEKLEAMDGVISVSSLVNIEATDGYTLGDAVTVAEFMKLADMDETSSKALFAYYAAEVGEIENLDLDTYKVPLIKLFQCAYELTQNDKVEMTQEEKDSIIAIHDQLAQALEQLQGSNYDCIAVQNSFAVQGEETENFMHSITVLAKDEFGTDDVYITGDQVSAEGFSSTFQSDTKIVSIISIILVVLILLLTFRSIAMPILLILVIQGSIWINFGIAGWTGSYVFFMCYLIVSSIQMGANIDYAIVISTRYNEMRGKGMSSRESIIKTLNLAFPTVLTSGAMMVFSGFLIGLRISDSVIAGMGYFVGTGTVITLILVNFALPQVLVLGDKVVQATTIRIRPSERLKRVAKVASAILLAGAILFTAIQPLLSLKQIEDTTQETVAAGEEMLQLTSDLSVIAAKMDTSDAHSIQYQFAESLLTDQIGSEQLSAGQSEYDQGQQDIASAETELSDGEKEYQEGLAEYNAAKEKLVSGKNQYDAGEAQLNAAKAEYAAGEQQLADARVQYADGEAVLAAAKVDYAAGEQQLAAAQAVYNEGQAQLDAVTDYYNIAITLQEVYLDLKAEYDQAVADGDDITAALLYLQVEAAKAALQTELDEDGYTMEQLIAEYQAGQAMLAEGAAEIAAGQAQLNAAAAEIAAGEQQLADAKAQIDAGQAQLDAAAAEIAAGEQELAAGQAELEEGYAQIAAAEQQLADARAQLDSGYVEVADGKTQLDAAGQQLEEGKNELAENKEKLADSINQINAITDENQKLLAGTQLLQSIEGVKKLVGYNATYSEICTAAEQYFNEQITDIQQKATYAHILMLALEGVAVVGVAVLVFFILRKKLVSRWIAVACIAASIVWALLWMFNNAFTSLPIIAALILAGAAILSIFVNVERKKPEDSVPELEDGKGE